MFNCFLTGCQDYSMEKEAFSINDVETIGYPCVKEWS
jgi:hypothetical protein